MSLFILVTISELKFHLCMFAIICETFKLNNVVEIKTGIFLETFYGNQQYEF